MKDVPLNLKLTFFPVSNIFTLVSQTIHPNRILTAMILVIDFGSQFNQLIARRVREQRVYCQIEPPVCGDGVREGSEQCDDGNNLNGDGCSLACLIETISIPAECGDGIHDAGEQLLLLFRIFLSLFLRECGDRLLYVF